MGSPLCGRVRLVFSISSASSGGYGSGYDRTYSGLFMDLLWVILISLVFGMDVFTSGWDFWTSTIEGWASMCDQCIGRDLRWLLR